MVSIALVVLDTVRKDQFERHFDWLDGVWFNNAYSTSHWTIPAHTSIWTGKYPSEIPCHSKSPGLQFDGTLPEVLQTEGYTTRLWTANPNLYKREGWTDGFDEAIGPSNLNPSKEDILDWEAYLRNAPDNTIKRYSRAVFKCIKDDCATVRSLWQGYQRAKHGAIDRSCQDVIERVQKTEFGDDEVLFINVMDAHTPYFPPSDYRSVDSPQNPVTAEGFADGPVRPALVRQTYKDTIRYLGDVYQTLFDELFPTFDYILTLSDHGELLGEYDHWNHGYGLYPELIEIPLVVSGRNLDEKVVERPVTLLDVHQTVAALADVSISSRGQHLLEDNAFDRRLIEYHGMVPTFRDQFERHGVGDCFDDYDRPLDGIVTSEGYAHQTHDDGIQKTDRNMDDIRREIRTLRDEVPRDVTGDEGDIDEAVVEQLRDLGYA